jgi:hypothetical protein
MPLGAAFSVFVGITDSPYFTFGITQTANSTTSSLLINNGLTNGQPTQALFVTPLLTANTVYDPHPLDVFFQTGLLRWYIAHEDGTPIQAGASYNIIAMPLNPNTGVTQQTNQTGGNWFRIFGANLAGQSNAVILITQVVIPGSCLRIPCTKGSPLNNSVVAASYDATWNWDIVDLTASQIPVGAIFNVVSLIP